jgi:hypothetical protein
VAVCFYDEDVEPQWKLGGSGNKGTGMRFWVEKTKVKGRPDREAGEYAVGNALWSPQRSRSGGDVYRFMREIAPSEVVLHLTDNYAFTGVSRVASGVEEFGGSLALNGASSHRT